jgi:hypothetical protein
VVCATGGPSTLALRAKREKEIIMRAFSFGRLAGVLLALAAIAIASPSTALAAPPANDNFASATVISSLPFSDSVDITEATAEPGETQFCDLPFHTAWYSFTPTVRTAIRADLAGSSADDGRLAVYEPVAPGFDGLQRVTCVGLGNSALFLARAGTTYYIQVGQPFFGSGSGILSVNLQEIPPLANDAFAGATPITALPYNDTLDPVFAPDVEPNEPTPSCNFQQFVSSVWYAFTPAVGGSVTARVGGFGAPIVAAYTGGSLVGLSEVGCNPFGVLTFRADAGTTYYLQSSGQFGFGPLTFGLDVAPAPVPSFILNSLDPSIFDTITFVDVSGDPGGVGFRPPTWNFGDGSTGTGFLPTHLYATDGDYTVELTVTTVDGRTASTSQVVQVRTHDVAITKFAVPQAASAGQTRKISVRIRDTRYPETVEIQLFKSVPGGFLFVGSQTQSVPVLPSNRTTTVDFNYTFTSDDAAIGKVTFKAIANLVGARDALPADNEAIASPTKVSH